MTVGQLKIESTTNKHYLQLPFALSSYQQLLIFSIMDSVTDPYSSSSSITNTIRAFENFPPEEKSPR